MLDEKSRKTLEFDKIVEELARLAQTAPGRALCADLTPSSAYDEVARRQLETDHAVRHLLERGALPFGGVAEIRPDLAQCRTGSILPIASFLRIAAVLRAVKRIRASVPHDESKPPESLPFRIYDRIRQLQTVPDLLSRLEDCIAGEDEIHDRASEELFRIRRRIKEAQAAVKEHLARIIRSHASSLQEALVTLRGDRYVVPVKADHRGDLPGIVHDTSSSGATLFIEPIAVVELNNKIRELKSQERDEIENILQELTDRTARTADHLALNADLLAELDFVMAKGALSIKMKAMPPVMNQAGRIRLRAARHPLIPADRVVPIDLELGFQFNTLVITGPNTGGKTVSLKTCGLFCLMAMAGLQIPAREGSEISVFEQILADIGDEQSIEQDLSTFSSHLKQLIRITEKARPDTLVLVDELGSGTDPTEGAALAIAILDFLRASGCRTVATTHYKELKSYAIQTDGVENACCEFDTKTLRPTYRLLIGVPGVSNAFAISRRLGLNPAIIDHAMAMMSEEGLRFEELVQAMEKSRAEADRLKEDAQQLYAQAQQLRDSLAEKSSEQRQKKRDLIQQAREEARELYQDAERAVEQQLRMLKEELQKNDAHQQHQLLTQTRQRLRSGRGVVENQIGAATLAAMGEKLQPDQIRIGELYAAPHLSLTGRLLEGPDARNQVVLQSGSMKITVSADALRMPASEKERELRTTRRSAAAAAGTKNLTMKAKLSASSEIKLLGQTVEEACSNLDTFIDQAVLSGMHSIRIIHGKGTGALRAAVQQMLKKDPRITSFHLAAFGEGDSGVTIAQFK